MSNDVSQIDLFYGDLTVNRAYVYARLPRPGDDVGLSLAGQVRGPRCLHAKTLPLTLPMVDLGPGPTLLAKAIVTEPCFWSPDLPAIYDVTINLLFGEEIVATARREIGLRWLGVRGRHFVFEGKRWVLRGVSTTSTLAILPRQWHEVSACYVAPPGEDEQLAEASQWGALAVVEVKGTQDQIVGQLRKLAMVPSAALVVIHGSLPLDFQRAQAAPNLLLAQPLRAEDASAVRPWANALWVEADDALRIGRMAAMTDLPVIAVRRLETPLPLDQARAACDALQRDLANAGQFAGYVV
jgi:hypothetical protein